MSWLSRLFTPEVHRVEPPDTEAFRAKMANVDRGLYFLDMVYDVIRQDQLQQARERHTRHHDTHQENDETTPRE